MTGTQEKKIVDPKEVAWMLRHALGKNHPYTMNCSGCAMIEKFLKENQE